MKISRDFVLLGSLVGVLATATVLYWSNRQVEHLTAAEAEFAQARTTHRAALGESTARLGQLKTRLVEVQRGDRVPPTYDEWSRQQAEARAAITALRQRIVDLEPSPTSPIAAQPGLVAASQRIRALSTTLLADWREFEQRGSGLTQPSRDFAAAKIFPLLTDELQPAIEELAAAESADADFKDIAFPRLLAPAQRIRLAAAAALVAFLAALGYSLLPRRHAAPNLVLKAHEKLAASRLPDLPGVSGPEATAAGQLKILVAEQNTNDSDLISLLLTNAGHAVTGCDNGPAARETLRNRPFALVLIDLHLPGKSGLAILTEARRRHPRLPAILIGNPEDDVPHFDPKGPALTEIIRRPLNPRTLLWTVSEILYPGENRESREYSPYVPEPDDDTPRGEAPVAKPVGETPPSSPPQRLRQPESPAPVAPSAALLASTADAPATPPPPPRITFVSRTPRASVTPPSAPPPSDPAPVAPAAIEPESSAPASLEPGATADPSSTGTPPAFPRKKMVRRKNLPPE